MSGSEWSEVKTEPRRAVYANFMALAHDSPATKMIRSYGLSPLDTGGPVAVSTCPAASGVQSTMTPHEPQYTADARLPFRVSH